MVYSPDKIRTLRSAMAGTDFVHLHVHSQYSLLDGLAD